jgi:hypothetical protein
MQMHANRLRISGFLAALLFVGITGCGKETVHSAPPTATAVAPTPGATAVPVNQVVTASFSEAMNPATINAANFTLTGTTGGAVAGQVTYNSSGSVDTTPSTPRRFRPEPQTPSASPSPATTCGPSPQPFSQPCSPPILSMVPPAYPSIRCSAPPSARP